MCQLYTSKLAFSHNEAHVYGINDDTNSFMVWNANGEIIQQVQAHVKPIISFACSPVDSGIVTCSEDFKVKYWNTDTPAM